MEATLESVAEAVSELRSAVEAVQTGQQDQIVVDRVADAVMERLRESDEQRNRENQGRRGFTPDDLDTDAERTFLRSTGQARITEILTRPAVELAPLLRRPAGDIAAFQQASDRVVLTRAILQSQASEGVGIDPRELRVYQEGFLPMLQAMDSTTAAEGDEYVPTELSSTLIDRVTLALRVAALWPAVAMPSNPWDIPGRGVARQRLGSHAEQTADTGQAKFKVVTPATRKIVLTAVKFAGEALVSKELEEDSIIAILPFIEEELVDYLSADIEDVLVNGDATGAHMDSDSDAAGDPRKNWDGLRQHTQTGQKVDAANAAPTAALVRSVRVKLGKYGVRPSDLVHIMSIVGYLKLLSDGNLLTVDKYGPQATILTGELGRLDGSPILVSEYSRDNLNATGVYDGVTTNRTAITSVVPRGFMRGVRRGLTIDIYRELYAESDQDAIAVTTRQAFNRRYPTTEAIIGQLYNVNAA